MNDEIKETLEYKIDFLTKSLNIGIPTKNRRYFNDIKDYITNLQQENERLKEQVAYLERSNNRREDTIIGLRFEVAEQEDYKSRCEKASDNLKRNYLINEHEHNDDVVNMTLNILQGENNGN